MAPTCRVLAIRAAAGGHATIVVEEEDQKNQKNELVLSSTSAVVQRVVLGAFLVGGSVVLEPEAGTSFVRRVDPFKAGNGPPPYASAFLVSRVATQRGPDGVDHLEVFLRKENNPNETAFNVYDPLFQQLLMAALEYRRGPTLSLDIGLSIVVEASEIVGVGLGKP